MRIGILGSGLMGGKLGTIFARAGHEVVFSYARSERKFARLAREARGGTRGRGPRRGGAAVRRRRPARGSLVARRRRAAAGGRPAGQARRELLAADERRRQRARRRPHHVGRGGAGQNKLRRSRVVAAFQTVPSEVLFGVYGGARRAGRNGRASSTAATTRPRSRSQRR